MTAETCPVVRAEHGRGLLPVPDDEWPGTDGYTEEASLGADDSHHVRVWRRIRRGDESQAAWLGRPRFLAEAGFSGRRCLRAVAREYLDLSEFLLRVLPVADAFALDRIRSMAEEIGTAAMAKNTANMADLLEAAERLRKISGLMASKTDTGTM